MTSCARSASPTARSPPTKAHSSPIDRVVEPEGSLTVEVIDYSLAVPYFGFLFAPLVRRSLQSRGTTGNVPWWAPPDRLDARASTALGVLCAVALIVGYLNTLLTQTIAFAADEFGSSDRAQGVSLAIVRCGVVLALIIGGMADRQGRRRLILALAVASPIVAATGALAPSLAWLTASQTIARPLAMALGILVAVVVVEEMPAGSRAYAISLLAMATALGAGSVRRRAPARRHRDQGMAARVRRAPARSAPRARREPHGCTRAAATRRRMPTRSSPVMPVGSGCSPRRGCSSTCSSHPPPRSRTATSRTSAGLSASRISLLTLLTNTPGGIGIIAGGRLADMRGRRIVGSVALFGGTICTVWFFFASGWTMWLASTIGAIVGAAAVPALGVYSAELFPTSLRGRANAAITVLALIGSGIGLDRGGRAVRSLGAVRARDGAPRRRTADRVHAGADRSIPRPHTASSRTSTPRTRSRSTP